MEVAAIGPGSMGLGAARSLLRAGLAVTGFAPRAEVGAAFAARGAAAGLGWLDAPASGGATAAAEGAVVMMASGAEAAFARAEPVLAAITRRLWRLGAEPGIGSGMKMVNQPSPGCTSPPPRRWRLASAPVPPPHQLCEVITTAAGNSWIFSDRVPHILDGDDTPRAAVEIFVKDLGIVLDAARGMTFPLPVTSAAHQLFLGVSAAGHGGRDDAFVIRFWQRLAGIPLPVRG